MCRLDGPGPSVKTCIIFSVFQEIVRKDNVLHNWIGTNPIREYQRGWGGEDSSDTELSFCKLTALMCM